MSLVPLGTKFKFPWNLNPNAEISFQENEFENVVYKLAFILSPDRITESQCVLNQDVQMMTAPSPGNIEVTSA